MISRITVTFALPGGGEHRERVRSGDIYETSKNIAAGARAAKRHGVRVANCLRITYRRAVLFEPTLDLGRRFR